MSQANGLNRRAFLRNAGLTALAGATAGTSTTLIASTPAAPGATHQQPTNGTFDFDTIYNRIGTDSTKFDQQIGRYGKGSVQVGMGIADIDFKAAPSITNAIAARVQHENWGYLDMDKWTPKMTEAVVSWNKRRYGVTIDPKSVVISNGVHPSIIAVLNTFNPKGSKVLLQTPAYNGFYVVDLAASQTKAEESPLKFVNGKFAMDFDDFERRISYDTHTFLLCNPHNPTGNCWSAEDLLRIGEICLKHRVIVLADEIHCDWVGKGHKYTPFASLPNKAVVDNSFTFKAASKSFGLAAHKVAWHYSTNPDLLARTKVNHRADLNTLGVVANYAAITEGEEWLRQANEYVDANHDFVNNFVHDKIPLIKVHRAQGTYLTWLDVTGVAERINSKKLADDYNRTKPATMPSLTPEQMIERFFVKTAKVHLNQGASYGKGGENHMRMNVGTSRKLIETALNNIASACRNPAATNLV